jgi:hypothetical protein
VYAIPPGICYGWRLMPAVVSKESGLFVHVRGTFYRAVVADACSDPLRGSTSAGRYSRPDQRTLYMSATEEGVAAAMLAHPPPAGRQRVMCAMQVEAPAIFDLRDDRTCEQAGICRRDAMAPWQDLVSKGSLPPSWNVRARLEELGANGLIDPSRQANGLWHLVLFRWNEPNGPSVRVAA